MVVNKISKTNIRKEIEKVSSSYTEEDLFSSKYFFDLLQSVITAITEPIGRVPELSASYSPENPITAFTNGNNVFLNTMCPLVKPLENNWNKYVADVGLATHESSHILWTDFVALNKRYEAWCGDKFSFYPMNPNVEGVDIDDVIQYLNSHPNYRKMLISIMKQIDNSFEDTFIENKAYERFGGVATLGLSVLNNELYNNAKALPEYYQEIVDGNLPIITFSAILFSKIRISDYYLKSSEDNLTEDQKKVKKTMDYFFELCEEEIDRLKWEANGDIRTCMLNRLMVKLMPLLPMPPEDEDYGDSGESQEGEGEESSEEQSGSNPGSGTPRPGNDYSDKEAGNFTSAIEEQSKQLGESSVPTGKTRPVDNEEVDKTESQANKSNSQEASHSTDAIKHQYEEAVKKTAEAEVKKRAETNRLKDLKNEINEIDKKARTENKEFTPECSSHSGFEFYRKTDISKGDRSCYYGIFDDVKLRAKHLTKKLDILLNQREVESAESGYLMGQKFDAKRVIRNDGKYFSRVKEPDGKITTSFALLIDMSGSMYGKKIENAKKVAILLEKVLRDLRVPLMVCGHTENYRTEIHSFVDFDTVDDKDCYRLADIEACGGNIDGAAITYCCEKLLKRSEDQRVLIVISDGLPAGTSYYSKGYNAVEDTKLAIAKYRKKGITIFGAAIDSAKNICNIYGSDYFFDCEDGLLEQQLCKIVKRYLRRK